MSKATEVVTSIPLTDIKVGDRLRKIDHAHAAMIAESIRLHGRVIEPITVHMEKKGQYTLIAGAHRLEAAKLAGLTTIPATIYEQLSKTIVRLMEIDENLCRHELSALDRAVFLSERKKLYEEMYPETIAGVAGAVGKHNPANAMFAFAENVAETIGLSRRTIEMAVKLCRDLIPEVRERLSGTPIARNQSELLALAKRTPDEQRKIIDVLTREQTPCQSVKAALTEVFQKTINTPDPNEELLRRLKDLWERAPQAVRKSFVAHVNRNRPLIKTEM